GAVDVCHGHSAPAVAPAPGATAPMPAATAATATAAADRRRGIRAVRGGMRRDSTAGRGPPAPARRPDTPAGASTLDVSAETRCCRGTLPGVRAFVCAGAGFLLAVLWFDLMFDVQVLRHRVGDEPDETLASIAAYYRRVTTAARPMNRLVMTAMLGTVAAIVGEVARGEGPPWVGWVSLALALVPVSLAAGRTFP